ncbi:MAG TPA: FtsX-like permease family protein [Dermatophilaceae bacterium]|nr:FtsX-like permease family protein [Dermatophilaceae bacterium]
MSPSRWYAGWRVALRVAARDVCRYRWRSLFIAVMVGLPVLLLTAGITLLATDQLSPVETIPRVMGAAAARVEALSGSRVEQSPDGASFRQPEAPPTAVPGFAPDSPWTPAKLARLTGGTVLPVTEAEARAVVGDRRVRVSVLALDSADRAVAPLLRLESGRWPASADEVVVSPAGASKGLPRSGRLRIEQEDGSATDLRVVGVGRGQLADHQADMVAAAALVAPWQQALPAFLVDRADPLTWAEVQRLNGYGLLVKSRQVITHPPSDAELTDAQRSMAAGNLELALVIALAAVGIFIETALLAGPAFAVSAARQRRSLALAAVNGAERRQLRRYVLGQALVLGVASSFTGAVLGIAGAWTGLAWWAAANPTFDTRPFDLAWPQLVGVVACSVLASVVAAMLPARGVGRLDVAGTLRGGAVSGRVSRGLPALGVVVMTVSAALVLSGVVVDQLPVSAGLPMVAGAIGLVVGAMLVVPALLALLGRVGARLPLALRLASRDTSRQRSRATPAVAAIMAAVAAMTAFAVGATSEEAQNRQDYQPQLTLGAGALYGPADAMDRAAAVVRRYAPDLTVHTSGRVYSQPPTTRPPEPGSAATVVAAILPGCTPAQAFRALTEQHCASLSSEASQESSAIAVEALTGLLQRLSLSEGQRQILQRGGVLVADQRLVRNGEVVFASGRTRMDADGGLEPPRASVRQAVPAGVVDPARWRTTFGAEGAGAVLLPRTATDLGWTVATDRLRVSAPGGMISRAAETAISEHLDSDMSLVVERGYQSQNTVVLLILFAVAGLLVLVAALVSTALSLAESQADMATLAAVGATRHTRRSVAAAQALVVAASGAVLGLVIGLVPGVAITWPLTTNRFDPAAGQSYTAAPVVDIPWLGLAAVVVLVPLLAAGLSCVAVRRAPELTRRLA